LTTFAKPSRISTTFLILQDSRRLAEFTSNQTPNRKQHKTMQLTRKSQLTGITRTKEINVTEEQVLAWEQGALIQNAMPHLCADDREFVKTGITGEEWDQLFGGTEVECEEALESQ
jgi:hypothetical protein